MEQSRTWRKWLHWIDFNIPQETFNLTWEDFNLTQESFNITWEIEHSRTQKLNGLGCERLCKAVQGYTRLCSNWVSYDSPVNNMWKLGGPERYKRTTDPAQESKQDSPFPPKIQEEDFLPTGGLSSTWTWHHFYSKVRDRENWLLKMIT